MRWGCGALPVPLPTEWALRPSGMECSGGGGVHWLSFNCQLASATCAPAQVAHLSVFLVAVHSYKSCVRMPSVGGWLTQHWVLDQVLSMDFQERNISSGILTAPEDHGDHWNDKSWLCNAVVSVQKEPLFAVFALSDLSPCWLLGDGLLGCRGHLSCVCPCILQMLASIVAVTLTDQRYTSN